MKKHLITATSDDKGLRIDQFLSQKVEDLSRNQARKALQRGGVYIGRRRIKICSYRMRGNEQLTIYVSPPGESPSKSPPETPKKTQQTKPRKVKSGVSFAEKDILFIDSSIIAINKPMGLPSQGTRSSDADSAVKRVITYLENRGEKNPNAHLIHRLDQYSTGLMIFSRSKQANISLTKQFKQHSMKKSYLAIVCGEITEDSGQIITTIPHTNRSKRRNENEKPDQEAVSDYEVLERFADYSWLKISPMTGKTHQIRIQFSQKGLPLLGDTRYKGEDIASFKENHPHRQLDVAQNRFLLHSYSLTLQHPRTDIFMELVAPIPDDMKEVLNLLRNY